MIGKFSQWASYLPWLVGCCFVLSATWITLRRTFTRYLTDSELLKIVTELTAMWKTKIDGMSGYIRAAVALGALAFAVLMVTAVMFEHRLREFPLVEMHNVEVGEPVGDFSYWLVDDRGKKFFATFCDTLGYPPPFDRGETILVLKFENRGTCWDMHNTHPKYVMLRDPNGEFIRKEN